MLKQPKTAFILLPYVYSALHKSGWITESHWNNFFFLKNPNIIKTEMVEQTKEQLWIIFFSQRLDPFLNQKMVQWYKKETSYSSKRLCWSPWNSVALLKFNWEKILENRSRQNLMVAQEYMQSFPRTWTEIPSNNSSGVMGNQMTKLMILVSYVHSVLPEMIHYLISKGCLNVLVLVKYPHTHTTQ